MSAAEAWQLCWPSRRWSDTHSTPRSVRPGLLRQPRGLRDLPGQPRGQLPVVELLTFRFSGVRTIVHQRPCTSVTCIVALIRMLMNVDETSFSNRAFASLAGMRQTTGEVILLILILNLVGFSGRSEGLVLASDPVGCLPGATAGEGC